MSAYATLRPMVSRSKRTICSRYRVVKEYTPLVLLRKPDMNIHPYCRAIIKKNSMLPRFARIPAAPHFPSERARGSCLPLLPSVSISERFISFR